MKLKDGFYEYDDGGERSVLRVKNGKVQCFGADCQKRITEPGTGEGDTFISVDRIGKFLFETIESVPNLL